MSMQTSYFFSEKYFHILAGEQLRMRDVAGVGFDWKKAF